MIITCPGCGKSIPDQAPACPECGRQILVEPTPGELELTQPDPTMERTRKKHKSQLLIAFIVLFLSCFCLMGSIWYFSTISYLGASPFGFLFPLCAVLGILVGVIWIVVTWIKMWLHNSQQKKSNQIIDPLRKKKSSATTQIITASILLLFALGLGFFYLFAYQNAFVSGGSEADKTFTALFGSIVVLVFVISFAFLATGLENRKEAINEPSEVQFETQEVKAELLLEHPLSRTGSFGRVAEEEKQEEPK